MTDTLQMFIKYRDEHGHFFQVCYHKSEEDLCTVDELELHSNILPSILTCGSKMKVN